ncbi:MAG: DUF305 domain-containing protein [Actinobacteria bacterium]|nr:DUF305 domain-containing protein [Actinomycetota bacterium]
MKRLILIALVPVALVLAACSNTHSAGDATHDGMGSAITSPGHDTMHGDDSNSGDSNAADVMFAQMMIPHHEQAVEMSTLAETRATDVEIVALAALIKNAQQPEIDLMTAWLTAWGYSAIDQDMAMDMGHGMQGMLSDAQLDELRAASGPQFDRLYATYMIAHHEGAIEMAKQVENSANSEVAALAKSIIAEQTAEIEQLKAFLDQ